MVIIYLAIMKIPQTIAFIPHALMPQIPLHEMLKQHSQSEV